VQELRTINLNYGFTKAADISNKIFVKSCFKANRSGSRKLKPAISQLNFFLVLGGIS